METQNKYTHWNTIIETQKSSGLSQIKWCKANEVSVHTFRYWINKLNSSNKIENVTQDFIPIIPAMPSISKSIEITIGAASVKIDDSFSPEILDRVIKVLVKHV